MIPQHRCIECTLLRCAEEGRRCEDCAQNIIHRLQQQELRAGRKHDEHTWVNTLAAVRSGCPVTFEQ